jgi:hypothetical protein
VIYQRAILPAVRCLPCECSGDVLRISVKVLSDVFSEAHALMQDTQYSDSLIPHPVDNEVQSDLIAQMGRWQVATLVADFWIATECLQCFIQLVAVSDKLDFASGLACVTQNIDEILFSLRGELQ